MKISLVVQVSNAVSAIDLLSQQVPTLSKSKLKDAMNKGALLWRQGKKQKRLRRAQTLLKPGEQIELNYDDDILSRTAPAPQLLHDAQSYSLWYKPPGMLSQGNEWGDHLSLLRFVELHFAGKRSVFLVHRLDREASGMLLIAHQAQTAAVLNQLIAKHQIEKHYQILVLGELSPALQALGRIDLALDGKSCQTEFRLAEQQPFVGRTLLNIRLISGRKHQIRRHFAALGHPVMGDPRYGENNHDKDGLALQAIFLSFRLPGKPQETYVLPQPLRLFLENTA